MRELDINNIDKQIARNSVFRHWDDLEEELGKWPNNKLLINRLACMSIIVAHIDKII